MFSQSEDAFGQKDTKQLYLSSLPLSDIFLGLAIGVLTRSRTLIHKMRAYKKWLRLQNNHPLINWLMKGFKEKINQIPTWCQCIWIHAKVHSRKEDHLHVSKLSSSSELTTWTMELKQSGPKHGWEKQEIKLIREKNKHVLTCRHFLLTSQTDLSFFAALHSLWGVGLVFGVALSTRTEKIKRNSQWVTLKAGAQNQTKLRKLNSHWSKSSSLDSIKDLFL